MGKNTVFLFCMVIATMIKLLLACDGELLEDFENLEEMLQRCPKNCTNSAGAEIRQAKKVLQCCLQINLTLAEECKDKYFTEGLTSLGYQTLTKRFEDRMRTQTFDQVRNLTCKSSISSKDFLAQLKRVFQQLCNLQS